jgi:type VI secretion system protein ImpA
MPSPSVVDLKTLLASIPGDNPAGVDLRWEPAYDLIKKSRTVQEDMLDSQAVSEINWTEVSRLAVDALSNRSKHLMVAAWLTEALTALYGFAGIRDGLLLLNGLLGQFWDHLYPEPDDGDLEPRVAPLIWLMDADRGARLPNRLRELRLLPHPEETLSWLYWKSRYAGPKGAAEDDEAFSRRKEEADRRERVFEEAARSADLNQVQAIYEDILAAKIALAEFDTQVNQRFQALAPATTGFRTAMEECEALVRRIAREKGGIVQQRSETESKEDEAAEAASAVRDESPRAVAGPIQSREEAFRRLAEVSAYLKRCEPQSPVPLLIDRAISWGKMPFEQLLREMIKDDTTRSQVTDLLGIRAADNS